MTEERGLKISSAFDGCRDRFPRFIRVLRVTENPRYIGKKPNFYLHIVVVFFSLEIGRNSLLMVTPKKIAG